MSQATRLQAQSQALLRRKAAMGLNMAAVTYRVLMSSGGNGLARTNPTSQTPTDTLCTPPPVIQAVTAKNLVAARQQAGGMVQEGDFLITGISRALFNETMLRLSQAGYTNDGTQYVWLVDQGAGAIPHRQRAFKIHPGWINIAVYRIDQSVR